VELPITDTRSQANNTAMIWSIDDLPSRIVPPAELQFAEQLVVGPPTWFGAGQCGTPAGHLPPHPRPARPGALGSMTQRAVSNNLPPPLLLLLLKQSTHPRRITR